jgi:spore coat protein H
MRSGSGLRTSIICVIFIACGSACSLEDEAPPSRIQTDIYGEQDLSNLEEDNSQGPSTDESLFTCPAAASARAESMAPLQTTLPIYSIEISPDDLAQLESDPYSNDYFPATVQIDNHSYSNAKVRYRGLSSRNFPKKSWKMKLPSGSKYADGWGYSRRVFNLNAQYTDPTMMREKLSYDIMEMLDVISPRARFVRLQVNGEYRGIFVDVENPRTDFFAARFLDDRGSLYQAEDSKLEELTTSLEYVGPFEKKLREEEPFDDLSSFVSALHGWSDAGSQLSSVMAQGALLRYMAANVLISQSDHIHKNYLLYHDIESTGWWYVIPWDHDLTFGRYYDDDTGGLEGFFTGPLNHKQPIRYGAFAGPGSNPTWGNHLYHRFLMDYELENQLWLALQTTLSSCVTDKVVLERIDHFHNLLRDSALEDQWKWDETGDYDSSVVALKEHVSLRWTWLCERVDCLPSEPNVSSTAP